MAIAGFAFFLDVREFAAGAHLAVPTDDAPASQGGEAKKSDETHRCIRLSGRVRKQLLYRRQTGTLVAPVMTA
jgi:hypothetical protein